MLIDLGTNTWAGTVQGWPWDHEEAHRDGWQRRAVLLGPVSSPFLPVHSVLGTLLPSPAQGLSQLLRSPASAFDALCLGL